jgi:hypothetical protein
MFGATLGEKALKMLPLTAKKIAAGGDVFGAFSFSKAMMVCILKYWLLLPNTPKE